MKTLLARSASPVVALFLALLLAACEGSPVPLSDPPMIAVDTSFVGLWEGVDPDSAPPYDRMRVRAFNTREYFVEYFETRNENDQRVRGDTSLFRVFLSDVGSRLVANVQCLCEDGRSFLFMLVDRVPEGLRLTPVNSELYAEFKDFERADQAYDRLARAFEEGLKLDEPAVFVKIADPSRKTSR